MLRPHGRRSSRRCNSNQYFISAALCRSIRHEHNPRHYTDGSRVSGRHQGRQGRWGTIRYGATQPYLLDAPLDLTFPVGGTNLSFAIVGEGQVLANTNNPPERPSLIAKHTGHVFDTTGNLGIRFENMSITTDTVTYPQTCFLRARNSDGRSRSDRMTNVYVFGYFSQTIDYNYGSEDDMLVGCQFYNAAPVANTSVLDISEFNIRGLTSSFTTIASGNQSTIDHKIFGGEFANFAGTTTSDVIRLDAIRFTRIMVPGWIARPNPALRAAAPWFTSTAPMGRAAA